MNVKRNWKRWAVLALAPLLMAGCSETPSQQDVSDARNEVREERRETEQARRQAARKVRENERASEGDRRKLMRPEINDEILEEQRETKEARREGRENIREEEAETRQAEEKAAEIEARFKAQNARDAYVQDVEAKLAEADDRITKLREQGEDFAGAAKEQNDKLIEKLETHRDRAEDALDDLKSADALRWEASRDKVDRAMENLSQQIEDSK